MPEDDHVPSENAPITTQNRAIRQPKPYQWFTTPQPIKRLFDRFPLVTYPTNELPQRSPKHREQHALYIFTTEDGARSGAASFNPGCLKWQAFLRFRRIPFITVQSNNHASPSGALPFLLASHSSSLEPIGSNVVASSRLQRWTRDLNGEKKDTTKRPERGRHDQGSSARGAQAVSAEEASSDMRYEAYMALLDHRIRNAYLYSLYLSPPNFASIVRPLYINSSSSNTLVQFSLSHQLRAAAQSELLKQSTVIDVEAMYRESDKALRALSELLGDNDYFFAEAEPGLFDADIFAYTNVLLDESLEWKDKRMHEALEGCQNLIAHRSRIKNAYF